MWHAVSGSALGRAGGVVEAGAAGAGADINCENQRILRLSEGD
jgi:hypothetical protein